MKAIDYALTLTDACSRKDWNTARQAASEYWRCRHQGAVEPWVAGTRGDSFVEQEEQYLEQEDSL